MAATLPQYIALQSTYNHKYLQFVHVLQFQGHDVLSPYTKFQVQVSEADQTLVHLRSCYNNKYWVPSTDAENWVLATADDPEEDQTKLSCTLFRPTYEGDDPTTVRLVHVNTKKYVALMDKPDTFRYASMYLASEPLGHVSHDVFTVIDWSSLIIFPQNIAVRGGPEGKYLSARQQKDKYLMFAADDLANPSVGHEVVASGAGNISIKSQYYDAFWTRATSNFILGDTKEYDVANQNIIFSPTRITEKENVFALKSLGNNEYCTSVGIFTPVRVEIPTLSASDATITALSQLEVVDRATSWNVHLEASDIRVSDARVPVPTFVVLGTNEAINDSESDVEMIVTLSYVPESSTRVWSSTMNGSLKVGATTVGITSPVPDELDGEAVVTRSFTGTIVWGREETESQKTIHTKYKVTVPARTKITIQATGQKRLWDVPFSYNQTITLADGKTSISKMNDGIYTGTQTLFDNFKLELASVK